MKRYLLFILITAFSYVLRAQTLEQCYARAQENYPLIAQYDLIRQTAEYSLDAAANAWIPQIVFSGQATYQSDVASFPEQLTDIYKQMGLNFEGLHRDQYRLAVDISQTLWDGGATQAARRVSRANEEVQRQSLEVQLYALKERVNSLFFGILVLQEQQRLNTELQEMLQSNMGRVASLIQNGLATPSDSLTLEAELLQTRQQAVTLQTSVDTYRAMLALFTAHPVGTLEVPDTPAEGDGSRPRPEYALYDLRLKAADAQEAALRVALFPRISAFGQGFYGSPGLNMFEDMMHSQFSWNYIVGLRMQWNLSSFFTRKQEARKISLTRTQVEIERDLFSFNQALQVQQADATLEGKRQIMQQDNRLVSLRQAVREATEAKVQHGVAGVDDLVRDIYSENKAKIESVLHRVDCLKYIYDQKMITNN